MSSVAGVATFNPFLLEFRDNPYPYYHAIREQDPVHWTFLSVWLLTRYSDVVAALRDPRFSADPRKWAGYAMRYLRHDAKPGPLAEFHTKWLLGIDPPDHTRIRALANRAFTPAATERLRLRIEQIVDGLFDRVRAEGTMEFIGEYAYPLPLLVIAEMLGVPSEDVEQLRVWSFELNPSFDPLMPLDVLQRADEIVRDMTQYFRRLIEARRRSPREDLLSGLLAARDDGDKLTEEELLAMCLLLFWAGHETTVNLLGNGMLTLLRHADQFRRLQQDPALIPTAVEEMLRFESPVQLTYRVALEDLEIGGRLIRKGQQVILSFGAANRDPAQFSRPDCFDVGRPDNHHVAFSYGIHFCIGAALARLQGQLTLRALLRRFDRLSLATDRLEWNPNILVRGLKALPITVELARQGGR